jgi:hypothetical protein
MALYPYFPPINAINIFNESQQVVEPNSPVVFNRGLSNNNNSVLLTKPGQYLVIFNASGTGTVAATTPVFQLQTSNGSNIPGAKASVQDAAVTDISGISFSTIVNINPSSPFSNNAVALSVVNTGDSATLQNASLTVARIR